MADRTVAPMERVNITYKPANGDSHSEEELPLKMLFIGDYTGQEDPRPLEKRQPISIDKETFQQVLANQNIVIDVAVPNVLTDEPNAPNLAVKLRVTKLADFTPDGIAEQIPEVKRLLELRDALTALKDPSGNLASFRRTLQAIQARDAK